MNKVPLHLVDWIPDELPCAPRPINGELLSSWARRLAAANELTLDQLCAAIGQRSHDVRHAGIFDYDAPPAWRHVVAAFARVPERWVWVLDLRQHFPSAGREWFLHDPRWPDVIHCGFCPACFAEQLGTRKPLHLKAEWALASVTRCLQHALPLLRFCPACGQPDPVMFGQVPAVQCYRCQYHLAAAPKPAQKREPAIAEIARLVVSLVSGQSPGPSWIGPVTAADFRALLLDLIWLCTTPELRAYGDARALVDVLAFLRFQPPDPYNRYPEPPFVARPWKQREAVVSVIAQVLYGPRSAEVFQIPEQRSQQDLRLYPFVEILGAVHQNTARWLARASRWPISLQNRLRQAQDRLGNGDARRNS